MKDAEYAYKVMLRGGRTSEVPSELEDVMIMRDFGWTREEYMEQPWEIVEIYKAMKTLENKHQANETKKGKDY